jgi:mono/diheme cytochrome c family protein
LRSRILWRLAVAPAHRRDGADHSGGFSVQPARPRSKPRLQAAAAIAGLALLATAGLSPLLPSAGAEAQTYGPAAAGSTDPLGQGWSDDMRQLYYYTPQGSRLIPLSWLKALERADQPGRFVDPDHLKAFGLIYHDNPRADLNPDGLPIGFALDPGFDGADRWVGLTCSACHTGEVEAKGTRLRIDGGPSNFDFDRFYAALATAVRLTVVNPDPARFERFAAAVLGAGASQEAMAKLRTAVAEFEVRLSGDAVVRRPQVASGFGRVDALNQILNALAVSDLGIAENLRPVDAPVSYPQLWVAPKLDWVQWNPVASNPLARNLGEVLGVFGSANLRTRDATLFQSTAIVPKLAAMESWLDELKSPRWPEDLLGAIDAAKADAGKRLFERDCSGCHNLPPFRMTDKADNIAGKTFVKAGRVKAAAVGTDPNYMRSFHARNRTARRGFVRQPSDRRRRRVLRHDGRRAAEEGRVGARASSRQATRDQRLPLQGPGNAGRSARALPPECTALRAPRLPQGADTARRLGDRALPPQRLGPERLRASLATGGEEQDILGRRPGTRRREARLRLGREARPLPVRHEPARQWQRRPSLPGGGLRP